MKHTSLLLSCLVSVFTAIEAFAQSIGINTATPHSTAILDINSTTGGLLLPRMTAAQRNAIASPPKGLMIFNTTFTRFEYYNGVGWRTPLHTEHWSRNGNYVYTNNDVGIGTAGPAAPLDVNGDIKISRGDLKLLRTSGAQTRIDFNYNSGTTNGLTQGLYFNMNGSGRSYLTFRHFDAAGEDQFRFGFNGEANATLKSSGDFILNSPSPPIIQLQNLGTDKGFVQVSGDDLRIGTNSGNAAGQVIFRADGANHVYVNSSGNVGIGTASPTERLHVVGDIYGETSVTAGGKIIADNINVTNEVRKPSVTGSFNLVPIAYGYVASDGTAISITPNATVAKTSTGLYEITVAGLNSACTIIVNGGSIMTAGYYTSNKCRVISNKNVSDPSPTPSREDASFYFLIFQP